MLDLGTSSFIYKCAKCSRASLKVNAIENIVTRNECLFTSEGFGFVGTDEGRVSKWRA